MADSPLKVVYLTAGAGGMYCGSCMQDNTLVRALVEQGVDAQLIPTYTPIRTDEENVSDDDHIFFGGINVFMQQKVPLYRFLPSFIHRFFDQRWLIRKLTKKSIDPSAKTLGALTISMLRGTGGRQRKEVRRLCNWLSDLQPDVVMFSNILIAGCLPALKKQLDVPVLVTLQGDDIFLESLDEPYKSRALEEIRRLAKQVDGFLIHSRYYADFMQGYFGIPAEKFHLSKLGIDLRGFPPCEETNQDRKNRPPTIGYLARLAPEKGLHLLVDAFIQLRQRPDMEQAKLRIAGWLGDRNREYADEQFAKLHDAGLGNAFEHVGEVSRDEKIAFLKTIDVLSVPTTYREPKGIYVVEALAAGVPVVQPEHGAFPELLNEMGGGRLVNPDDSHHLAEVLEELLADRDKLAEMGRSACSRVHTLSSSSAMGQKAIEIIQKFTRNS